MLAKRLEREEFTAKNPFAAKWADEESKAGKAATKDINAALGAKAVLADIDKNTTQCASGSKPPKHIVSLFEKYSQIAVKLIRSSHAGMDIAVALSYAAEKEKWRATAVATATYRKSKVGAARYVIQPGDTLFNIAKKHYGDGRYFPAIVEANPDKVKLKGDFIIAYSQIELPALDILDPNAVSSAVVRLASGSEGKKQGKPVTYPDVNADLSKAKMLRFTKNTGSCIVEIDVNLKGGVTATRQGPIKVKYDMKTYSGEMTAAIMKNLDFKVTLDTKKCDIALSSSFAGPLGKASFAVTKDFKAKVTLSPKPFTVIKKDVKYTGTIGADIEIRFICVPKGLPEAVKVQVGINDGNAAADFFATIVVGGVIVIGGGIVLGGAAITITSGAATAGTVSHGTAVAAGGGLVLSGINP